MICKKLKSILFIFLITLTLISCNKSIDHSEVKDYADSITASILYSINNLDYDSFSSYLCDEMKASYELGTFQSETNNILDKLGNFKSLTFVAGEEANGYVSIIYDATYSNVDKPVRISIRFKKDDDTHKVQELYFASSRLKD